MNEREQQQGSGLKTFIVGAVIVVLIGIWSLFVAWRADIAPSPALSEDGDKATISEGAAQNGEVELARRIIVYQTTSVDGVEIVEAVEVEVDDSEDLSNAG
ncbi:hypothetical protein [Cohnella luojiensis]|uniref:Uncharacterized protein n=1 Tax=Cohnella luojiensis TaxID=652876 RepID=A0A4Y8M795_9BACL|nr:hypothetical protein [Cohnella luojiensis]TFE29449.1 hypothetical protein E2980_05480 [Cohnella luojiensis]